MTSEIAEKAAALIRQGHTLRAVAGSLGIPWETWKRWRRQGESGEDTYVHFWTLTRAAEADAELAMSGVTIERAKGLHTDDGAAKAAQWWLERRRWKDWWLDKAAKQAGIKEPSNMQDAELKTALLEALRGLAERTSDALLLDTIRKVKELSK